MTSMQGGMAALTNCLRHRVTPHTDRRIGLMNEMINSMRLIKMYAWETPFADQIKEVRKREVAGLRKMAFASSAANTISPTINILAAIVTFLALTWNGAALTASQVFTVFSVFMALQFTIGQVKKRDFREKAKIRK